MNQNWQFVDKQMYLYAQYLEKVRLIKISLLSTYNVWLAFSVRILVYFAFFRTTCSAYFSMRILSAHFSLVCVL